MVQLITWLNWKIDGHRLKKVSPLVQTIADLRESHSSTVIRLAQLPAIPYLTQVSKRKVSQWGQRSLFNDPSFDSQSQKTL